MAELTREFFEAYYQAYNSEDPNALKHFYADDVVLVSAQGEQRGLSAMLDTYHYLIDLFEDRMTARNILIDGDSAAVEIIDKFTAKKAVAEFMGSSFKTGDTMTLRLCALYRVSNNKITHVSIYTQ